MWGMTANGKVQVRSSEVSGSELTGAKAAGCDSHRSIRVTSAVWSEPEEPKGQPVLSLRISTLLSLGQTRCRYHNNMFIYFIFFNERERMGIK